MELSSIRQEIDRRIHEKEEEFENTRRNHARALESMQATLEAEARAKLEALKQKKKLESDMNQLEVSLDQSNRTNVELQKSLKRIQQNVAELESQLENEQQQREEARQVALNAERRSNLLIGEIEELKTNLEQAERSRRAAENELHEIADRLSELSSQNASFSSAKRQLESSLAAMQSDLDEALNELKNSEEKSKKISSFKHFRFLFGDRTVSVFQAATLSVSRKNFDKNKNTAATSKDCGSRSNNKSKIFRRDSTKPREVRSKEERKSSANSNREFVRNIDIAR